MRDEIELIIAIESEEIYIFLNWYSEVYFIDLEFPHSPKIYIVACCECTDSGNQVEIHYFICLTLH